MFKKPKEENLAKLTPEQRKVYDNWVKEEAAHTTLVSQVWEAMQLGDKKAAQDYCDQLQEVTPSICEHDCSIWDDCSQCIEIERILYPEDFAADGERLQDDALLDKRTLN